MIADPPAYTPWYDQALAAALGRSRGPTSSWPRPGFASRSCRLPTGHRRSERFYPALPPGSSAARGPDLPIKAVEHLAVAWSLARLRADVLHLQWLSLPQLDVAVLIPEHRRSSPHTTCCHAERRRETRSLDAGSSARFDRVVVHTERGRETLLGAGRRRRDVIPHPVYPSSAVAGPDNGHTILALGVTGAGGRESLNSPSSLSPPKRPRASFLKHCRVRMVGSCIPGVTVKRSSRLISTTTPT